MTRRPLRPIKEQGRFAPKREIDWNSGAKEVVAMAIFLLPLLPIYTVARWFGWRE